MGKKTARRKCTNIYQMFLNLKVCHDCCHSLSSPDICTLKNEQLLYKCANLNAFCTCASFLETEHCVCGESFILLSSKHGRYCIYISGALHPVTHNCKQCKENNTTPFVLFNIMHYVTYIHRPNQY